MRLILFFISVYIAILCTPLIACNCDFQNLKIPESLQCKDNGHYDVELFGKIPYFPILQVQMIPLAGPAIDTKEYKQLLYAVRRCMLVRQKIARKNLEQFELMYEHNEKHVSMLSELEWSENKTRAEYDRELQECNAYERRMKEWKWQIELYNRIATKIRNINRLLTTSKDAALLLGTHYNKDGTMHTIKTTDGDLAVRLPHDVIKHIGSFILPPVAVEDATADIGQYRTMQHVQWASHLKGDNDIVREIVFNAGDESITVPLSATSKLGRMIGRHDHLKKAHQAGILDFYKHDHYNDSPISKKKNDPPIYHLSTRYLREWQQL